MRFPGFQGEWETKKLGEICRMQAGKFVSASEIFEKQNDDLFPCYGGNGLRGYTKSFNQDGIFSLIGRQGALCGNITLANGKFHATEHAVVVTPNANADTIWMFYLLTYLNLNQYATGMAQPGLSVQNLEKIEIIFPKVKIEQQKIASFLSLIDQRITTQSKIIEELHVLKASTSKKIFSQEFRFKDENGNDFPDWESKKLGEVLEIQGGYAFKSSSFKQGNTKVIRIGDIEPRISIKNFSGVYSNEIPNEKYIVKKNDFVMALSGATFGKVGKILDDGIAYINQRVALFKTEQFLEFFYQLVLIEDFKNYIYSIPAASAQPNISNNDIANYKTAIPCEAEQQKIAKFLSSIDSKIDIETQLLQKLEEQKKFLLQQLFV